MFFPLELKRLVPLKHMVKVQETLLCTIKQSDSYNIDSTLCLY